MDYTEFVKNVEEFGERFFENMMKQVQNGMGKDWEDVKFDKKNLLQEQQERLREFREELKLLKNPPVDETNWKELENLFDQMKKEIR